MHLALTILHLPFLELSGEVESPEGPGNGGVGVGILSVASIAIGWVAIFALWWFVFRDKARSRRRKRRDPPQ
jgi:hypothetical protein